VNDFADAGAGGERGEEDFGFFGGGGDGGTEIEREECGKGRGGRGVGGGGELRRVEIFEEAPAGGLARRVGRDGAERGPEFDESAEDGSFGELAAKDFAQFDGSFAAFAVEGFPGAENDGGGTPGGSGFPLAVTPDGGGPGQDIGSDEEVGLAGGGPEQVEGDGAALLDEARGESHGAFNRGGGRREAGGAEDGFNEGRRGRGELGVAWQKEAEADLVEPESRIVEGNKCGLDRQCGALMPERGARDL
jgi:hypothetical protein